MNRRIFLEIFFIIILFVSNIFITVQFDRHSRSRFQQRCLKSSAPVGVDSFKIFTGSAIRFIKWHLYRHIIKALKGIG